MRSNFEQIADRLQLQNGGKGTDTLRELLPEFQAFAESGEFKAIVALFDKRRKDIPLPLRDQLIDAVNELVLFGHQREWTKHGIQRSFRFWSPEEQREYVRESQELVAFLQDLFGMASFGYGAVLGGIREQALIEHDDDVDLLVALPMDEFRSFAEGVSLVAKRLEAEGCMIGGHDLTSHRRVRLSRWSVDLFIGYEHDGTVSWMPGPRETLLVSDVFPTSSMNLLGVECSFPARPEVYLSKVYGDTWRTPIKRWRHAWAEQLKEFGL